MKEPASARRAGDLSSLACLTRKEVRSRKTASMSGWFKRTAILTNPSGVPICNFSSCLLPTKGAFSIPKIAPPAPRTTEPNLLSASIKLVMPSLPTFEPKAERPAVFHGRRVPTSLTARLGFYAGQCTCSTLNSSRPGSSVRSFSAGERSKACARLHRGRPVGPRSVEGHRQVQSLHGDARFLPVDASG